jgi:hypothetical protein
VTQFTNGSQIWVFIFGDSITSRTLTCQAVSSATARMGRRRSNTLIYFYFTYVYTAGHDHEANVMARPVLSPSSVVATIFHLVGKKMVVRWYSVAFHFQRQFSILSRMMMYSFQRKPLPSRRHGSHVQIYATRLVCLYPYILTTEEYVTHTIRNKIYFPFYFCCTNVISLRKGGRIFTDIKTTKCFQICGESTFTPTMLATAKKKRSSNLFILKGK